MQWNTTVLHSKVHSNVLMYNEELGNTYTLRLFAALSLLSLYALPALCLVGLMCVNEEKAKEEDPGKDTRVAIEVLALCRHVLKFGSVASKTLTAGISGLSEWHVMHL